MDRFSDEAYKSVQNRNSAPPEYKPCHDNVTLIRAELRAIMDERDMLRQEVDRLRSRLEAYQRHSQSSASYDFLKSKCDEVMEDLQTLQHQHGETVQNYLKAKEKAEQLSSTVASLHSQLGDSAADKLHLQEENSRLRSLVGDSERLGMTVFHRGSTVDNDDCEIDLRNSRIMSSDLDMSASEAAETIKILKQENGHLTEELQSVEREYKLRERNLLATMQAEKASLIEQLRSSSNIQNRMELQLAAAVASRGKDARDLTRIREERNAAVNEYELIMSERDSVLRETEQLRSMVANLESKLEGVEKEKQAVSEEAERAREEFEASRREAEALARSSSLSMDSSYLKEIERLRRDMDKLQGELLDALHELEGSKRRCNWAFSERDKIVGERESIRVLCDQLRRERDAAVSDLISALRDSDETRRQKNDISRELKELRERYESLLEKDMGSTELNLPGHHHSRDSAIDTDLQELETETLEIDLGKISSDLGFDLIGGSNDVSSSNCNLVFIRNVHPASTAYGKLRVNDQILRINGVDVSNVDRSTIMHAIRNATPSVHLTIRRRKLAISRVVLPVSVRPPRDVRQDLGMQVEQGIYISHIVPGSVVAREDCLSVGDRIVSVNGISLDGKSVGDVRGIIEDCREPVFFDVVRCNATEPSSGIVSPASAYRTPSSPLPAREFPHPLVQDIVDFTDIKRTEVTTSSGSVALSASVTLRKSSGSQTDGLESLHSDVLTVAADGASAAQGSDGKRNFLDKAKSLITKPLRGRLQRTRGGRPKSEYNMSTVDSFNPVSNDDVGLSVPIAKVSCQLESKQHSDQSPSRRKASDTGHGTWPKYHAHGAVRPSILPLYTIRPSSSTDEESPLLPVSRGIEIRRSESARHHRSQNSDSVVSYIDPNCNSFNAHKSGVLNDGKSLSPGRTGVGENVTPLGPHYAKRFPDQNGETMVTVRPHVPEEHHYTVISHFPVEHNDSSISFGPNSKYSPRPLPHSSASTTATCVPSNVSSDRMLQNSSSDRTVMSSANASVMLPARPQPFSLPSSDAASLSRPCYTSVTSPVADEKLRSVSGYNRQPCQWMPSQSTGEFVNYRPVAVNTSKNMRHSTNNDIPTDSYRKMYSPDVPSHCPDGLVSFPQLPSDRQGRIKMPSSRGPSPISPVFPVSHPGQFFVPGNSYSLPSQARQRKDRNQPRPRPGETRMISADLHEGPFGIEIECGQINGGVFVSGVVPESIAAKSGVFVGDQLLEVCGINMRNATKDIASNFLRHCGGNITLQVQYNPTKFFDVTASGSNTSSDESVKGAHRAVHSWTNNNRTNSAFQQSLSQIHTTEPSNTRSMEMSSGHPPRMIVRKKEHPHDPVGLTLVGGNAVGIFVRDIIPGSLFDGPNGAHCGDQILQFNGIDFYRLTLEQAVLETRKPCDEVRCCAQYNIIKYNSTLISKLGGDAFFMRAINDYCSDASTPGVPRELSFARGDVLFVDSTAHGGQLGVWHAWLLDTFGDFTGLHGVLPSKTRIDDDTMRRRSICDILEASASCPASDFNKIAGVRSSGSFRRSLFRRRRHRRSDSRDNSSAADQIHTSHSDASINSGCSEGSLVSLERVEKFDSNILRPVILFGPFAGQLIAKLTSESPDKFTRFDPETPSQMVDISGKHKSPAELDIDLIRSVMAKNRHCLLNTTPDVVEYLHRCHIYPIVLFIKHKSPKQIREVKDTQFLQEKVSSKMAKDLFERYEEYERLYKKTFSDVIPGGNLAFMCCKIKMVIDREQRKVVWVAAESSAIH